MVDGVGVSMSRSARVSRRFRSRGSIIVVARLCRRHRVDRGAARHDGRHRRVGGEAAGWFSAEYQVLLPTVRLAVDAGRPPGTWATRPPRGSRTVYSAWPTRCSGSTNEARTHLERALELYRQLADDTNQAHTQFGLAGLLERQGRYRTRCIRSSKRSRCSGITGTGTTRRVRSSTSATPTTPAGTPRQPGTPGGRLWRSSPISTTRTPSRSGTDSATGNSHARLHADVLIAVRATMAGMSSSRTGGDGGPGRSRTR